MLFGRGITLGLNLKLNGLTAIGYRSIWATPFPLLLSSTIQPTISAYCSAAVVHIKPGTTASVWGRVHMPHLLKVSFFKVFSSVGTPENTGGIDNLSITNGVVTVPEPSLTWLSAGGLLFLYRRSKRSASAN